MKISSFILTLAIILITPTGPSHYAFSRDNPERESPLANKKSLPVDNQPSKKDTKKQKNTNAEDPEKKIKPDKNLKKEKHNADMNDDSDILADDDSLDDDSLIEDKGAKFKFKGEVKNLYTFKRTRHYMDDAPLLESTRNLSADLTRLRLSPEFSYSDILSIKLDYDNEFIFSNYNKSLDFDGLWRYSGYNDFSRMMWEPRYDRNIYYRTKIHRFYARVNYKAFSATLGRQQIRFGSGRLWNPLDILNPISPTFIEGAEEQQGTDALRMDIYPDDKTEISIVFNPKLRNNKIADFHFENCNYIARVKTSASDIDFAVLGGYVSQRGVGGFDMSAVVLGGMLRGSLIFSKAADSAIYFQANAGYEYTFKNGLYLLVEYFFNQNGINFNFDLKISYYRTLFHATIQDDYDRVSNQSLTLNQHYGALALGYEFHPLVRGDLFLISDIQGRGIFYGPSIKVNVMNNMDIETGFMGAYVFNHKSSDFNEFVSDYLYHISAKYSF